ncbi:MAG: bifunctional oligoribonuclease/PAP phosphatase NrnA [Candidatus Sericytochromatia bacterium]|nr:bifunctional oligoribonuclease/PAP phosphatase NrnA [Candidatus Tanganyikabacteria bacterium]
MVEDQDLALPVEHHAVADVFRARTRWVVASHMNPDADTLGSAIALKVLLRKLGHEVVHVCPDPVPQALRFLGGTDEVRTSLEGLQDWALATCDAADIRRFGADWAARMAAFRPLVVVDHHISNQAFGTDNLIMADAAATGEVVFRLFRHLGVQLDREAADALYAAISTDTGSFRYEGTRPHTHLMAARLIEAGVSVSPLNQALYEETPARALRIQAAALGRMRVALGGRVALASVSRAMLSEAGADDEDCEGIVEQLRSIQGVDTSVFMRELAAGGWKVSFRSKGLVDVNSVARIWDGGGHVRASGCTVSEGPAVLEERFLEHIGLQLDGVPVA